jgi:type IV pilus assembly protein PilY1
MNAGCTKTALFIVSFGLTVGAGFPVAADDTEIFVTDPATIPVGAQPNVLFIVDTSGSMDTAITVQVPFDPKKTYSGQYDSDGVYWVLGATSTIPASTSTDFFAKANNFCAATQAKFETTGIYGDEVLAWRSDTSQWADLNSVGTAANRPVECANDAAVHGDSTNSSSVFAADGPTGPWHTDNSTEPFWNTRYTLFDGNWLNWNDSPPTQQSTRLKVVQDVTLQISDNFQTINLGLQRFNDTEGGGIIDAVSDLAVKRSDFRGNVISLQADGYTPLSEVLYEAGQYFMGRAVDYGNIEPHKSVPQTRVGLTSSSNTYLSPADQDCESNFIVLLTDGEPTEDSSADGKVAAWPDFDTKVGASCDGSGDGHCLDDIAEYLFETDVSTAPGFQNVTTYTVGFNADFPLLQSTATRGGGEYRTASSAGTLTAVLEEIFRDILDNATTFTAPTVPVNVFNRTRNMNDVFVSVFEPSRQVHWPGNLKKYKIVGGKIVGQGNTPAVDPGTGFFSDTSHSFWSPATPVDGNLVERGGAASQLPNHVDRALFTNLAAGPLSSGANSVSTGNAGITAALVGAPATERNSVIQWARGLDLVDEDDDGDITDTRHVMGDPLHVTPAAVIFSGTVAAPDQAIFFATNDGYFHAIDGSELWSFIPSRLLPRLHDLYLNNLSPSKQYGLDGNIVVYIQNDDGLPTITGPEEVILLFGMRRGGDAVFALKVTDRAHPELLWEVDSGDLPGLGQTWSDPVVAKVDFGSGPKEVAIFGGGYDAAQDGAGYRADSVGNAIYMVDLANGNLIWSAGNPTQRPGVHDLGLVDMKNSIPAPVKVLDLSRDGLADRMYASDTGGRIWRFDIVNGNAPGTLVEGGVMASLGAADLGPTPPASDVRRFYVEPDIASVVADDQLYLTVNIGSGFRAHPLDTMIDDEFYSIRDFHPFDVIASADYTSPVTRADLIDITNLNHPSLLAADAGWRLSMGVGTGEKIMAESFTFSGEIFFTSFTPDAGVGASCVLSAGLNKLYRISLLDGSPTTNLDQSVDDTVLTETDRTINLKQGGISPEPVFIFTDDMEGDPVVCIGAECLDPGFDENAVRTYWFQDETQ